MKLIAPASVAREIVKTLVYRYRNVHASPSGGRRDLVYKVAFYDYSVPARLRSPEGFGPGRYRIEYRGVRGVLSLKMVDVAEDLGLKEVPGAPPDPAEQAQAAPPPAPPASSAASPGPPPAGDLMKRVRERLVATRAQRSFEIAAMRARR